jgi:hypothetical protein
MAGLVVPQRLQDLQVLPLALGRFGIGLEHAGSRLPHLAQLLGGRADHMLPHDGGGGLAEGTGLHVMGEGRHDIAIQC